MTIPQADAAARYGSTQAPGDMEAFVALLRGINVGRGNRVPMAGLRTLLEQQGYEQVSTLLNSGNAVFCAPSGIGGMAHKAISHALVETFGISVPVIVKSAPQFAAVVAANPYAVAEPSRLLVALASRAEDLNALAALEPLLFPSEALHIAEHAAYLHCPAGVSASKAASSLLGKLGRGVTTRNWSTVLKIAAALSRLPAGNPSRPNPLRGTASLT